MGSYLWTLQKVDKYQKIGIYDYKYCLFLWDETKSKKGMWQEIITYIILSLTFGYVLYKALVKPLILLFRPKTTSEENKNIGIICSSCSANISCEKCAFYNPRPATYLRKIEKLDFVQES